MEAYIKAVSYYIPTEVLDNEQLHLSFPEWPSEKIFAKTGIHKRYITPDGMLASDMAVLAAEQLFEEYNIDRKSIDFIILCTQSPDYFLPTTACLLQERLQIPTSAGAFDYNLGCSGYIYGLAIAKGFIYAGIAKNILLLTAETYSKFLHPSDKSNRTIFGDAAAATLVSAEDGFASVGGFNLGTDGKGGENLIVKNGGLRNARQNNNATIAFDEYGNTISDDFLFMNGAEIFNFTSEMVPVLVHKLLEQHKLQPEDIDLYIFHQANKFMLNHLRKKLKIEEEKFFLYLEDCGNTVSSTIPIALKEAMRAGKMKQNDKVLLAGFGVGYSWGGTVITVL